MTTAASRKYFGDWTSHSDVARDFSDYDWSDTSTSDKKPAPGMATDDEILFATYTYESYSGSALVIFERDGKLYEVNGSHCSCYGLEGQWDPEETSWPALAMRNWYLCFAPADSEAALAALIKDRNVSVATA